MPRHSKERRDHNDRDRHDRRDRDLDRDDRDRRDRGRSDSRDYNNRDRDRNRSRDHDRSYGGGGGGYNRDRYDNRDRGGSSRGFAGHSNHNQRGREEPRYPRGNHNNGNSGGGHHHNYGYAPPPQVPQMGMVPPGMPPGFMPFGGPGLLPLGMPLPMLNFGPPGLLGPPPVRFPMGQGRDDRREDVRAVKRDREYSRDRGRDAWDNKRPRLDREMQEEHRVTVSTYTPGKIFIEDVNLDPEFAFRLDTSGNMRHLKYSTLNLQNTSRIEPVFRRDDIFGATEEELSKLPFRSVFSRCVRPVGIDDDGNPVDDDGNLLDEDGRPMKLTPEEKLKTLEALKKKEPAKRKHAPLKAVSFFSVAAKSASGSGGKGEQSNRNKLAMDGNNAKKNVSIRDEVEHYNVELRNNPKDIELWRKFVKFQDLVFQHETDEMSTSEDKDKKSKAKKNKRALAEKKISILEKALESSPKNLELNLDRLELVYEIYKPSYVLREWKKLVTVYQQLDAFWNEYLRFACTQSMLYNCPVVISTFEKSFQKFRLMCNPTYPKFQRPEKFLLLLADLLLGLALVLRDSGFTEKAIALHQAQLEIHFNFPHELIREDKDKADLDKVTKLFEIFWDSGSQRFGEPCASGWAAFVQNNQGKSIEKSIVGLTEQSVSDYEFKFVEILTSLDNPCTAPKSVQWVTLESFRNICYWLPWKESSSDAESCDDTQRIVLSSELTPFMTLIPDSLLAPFDRSSVHFRTVVNFLLLLQEDFLPRTQTLDSILSSFNSISLTQSQTFFSEIYYWKTFLTLYMPPGASNDIVIPDGFDLPDYSNRSFLPSDRNPKDSNNKCAIGTLQKTAESDTPPSTEEEVSKNEEDVNDRDEKDVEEVKEIDVEPSIPYTPEVLKMQKELLKTNIKAYQSFVKNVVEKSVEQLPPKFASLLARMYIKYEQRCTYNNDDTSPKARMKSAKEFLQNEKLRNSVPLYGEMAMLEYFCSKNQTKASAILVKAINSSVQSFQNREETAENNFDTIPTNWETLAEVTRLYKLLAELQLSQNHSISLHILTALGAHFRDVRVEGEFGDLSKNELLIARRQYEKILGVLLEALDLVEEEEEDIQEGVSEKKKRNFFGGNKSVDYLVQNTHLLIEWASVFGLFLYLSADYGEASDLFRKVLKKVNGRDGLTKGNKYNATIVNTSHIREQLYLMWCKIGILEVAKNPMQNAKFRQVLIDALTEFPASPPLLVIFTDVEKQSSIAGKIWRLMTGSIKKESLINSLHWAPVFMALGLARKVDELRRDEEVGLPVFGLGGPAVPPDTIFHKLDAVLATAEQNPCTRNCPLIWRIHLKLNASRVKQSKANSLAAAKAVYYDAIRHCPANKVLFLDALSYFPDLLKEIQDLMKEKQFYIRLPMDELNVLLENEDEEFEGDAGNDTVDIKSEEDSEDDDVEEVGRESALSPPAVTIDDDIIPVVDLGVEEAVEENTKVEQGGSCGSSQQAYDVESMSEGEIGEDDDENTSHSH